MVAPGYLRAKCLIRRSILDLMFNNRGLGKVLWLRGLGNQVGDIGYHTLRQGFGVSVWSAQGCLIIALIQERRA